MRLVPFIASVIFFAASGSAFAADCTKGMLWPYTRNPGDCLTDAEIKAGQTGAYAGPVNTNIDVSSIKPDPSVQSSGGTVSGSTGVMGGYFSGGLLGDLLGSGSSSSTNAVSCNKGYLWPFVREPGDCLTAEEKLTNKNGVYRGGEVTQVSARNAPASDGGAANPPANAAPPASSSTPAPTASSASACQKGWLWPFVREPGACLTATETQANKTGVYRGAEVTQVSASNAPAGNAQASNPSANAPAPTAESAPACQKSWLWPFVRKAGDCPTDAQKK